MGQHDAVEGNGAEAFGALEVAFLRGREQRVQHLDGGLEHFHELEQALVREAQAAGVGIRVGVVLGVGFELADVDLADQRRDVLVVLVAGLGLGDRDLAQHRGVALDHLELADVAAVLLEPLHGPGRQDAVQVAHGDAVLFFEDLAVFEGVEEPEGRFVHRGAVDRIEGHVLHELLQALRDRALAAADGPQQVKDLLLFFESLRGVAEIGHHLLDGIFHAIELLERRIDLDDLVREDPRKTGVIAGIYQFRLANGLEHSFGGRCICRRIAFADIQIFLQRENFLAGAFVAGCKVADHVHGRASFRSAGLLTPMPTARDCVAPLGRGAPPMAVCRGKLPYTLSTQSVQSA
ncbi:hypothetical protein D3C72_1127690 [compost metagenome]